MTTLVIAAHPDDEVLGCAGTIAKLTGEGEAVHVAILGEGLTARYGNRSDADKTALGFLAETSKRVAGRLGVKEVVHYSLPDNRFDSVPLLDVIKIVEELVDRLKPCRVFTHHGGDLNIDHSITFRATVTALRPFNGSPVKSIYMYEVPSSTDWAFGKVARGFSPNAFVDVSGTLEAKLEAMRMYETEMRVFPHPRSEEALRATAIRWGSVAGLNAAEAFEIFREIL